MGLKIRKGDTVMVIAGDDKGKTGRVLSVDAEKSRVIVEKVNFVKRHTKPRGQGAAGRHPREGSADPHLERPALRRRRRAGACGSGRG